MDGTVIKSLRTQLVEVTCCHAALPVSKVSRKLAERPVCVLEWCAAPVSRDSVYEGIAPCFVPGFLCDLSPEIVRMGLSSIMAIQLHSYNRGNQLSLHAREWRIPVHYGTVLCHTAAQHARIDAHYLHDVPHPTGSLYGFVIFFLQQAGGLLYGNLGYPRHYDNDRQKITLPQQRC